MTALGLLILLALLVVLTGGHPKAYRGQDILDHTPVPPQPYSDGPIVVKDIDD